MAKILLQWYCQHELVESLHSSCASLSLCLSPNRWHLASRYIYNHRSKAWQRWMFLISNPLRIHSANTFDLSQTRCLCALNFSLFSSLYWRYRDTPFWLRRVSGGKYRAPLFIWHATLFSCCSFGFWLLASIYIYNILLQSDYMLL